MKIWPWKRTWVSKRADAKARSLDFNSVKRIAVIKHAALGDLVLTRPFLLTLRRYFPNAHITLSVASHYMNGIPNDLVDSVHITYRSKENRGLLRTLQNYRSLGEHDIIFDITAVTRSFWLALLNRATLKVGYKHKIVHRFVFDVAVTRTGFKFEAENFLDQLLVLGLHYEWPLQFKLQADPSPISEPYILYFPTASDSYKSWETSRFIDAIAQLSQRYPQHKHVILSGIAEWEQKLCAEIMQALPASDNLLSYRGGESTAAVVAGASVLVANDTGIRNLAIGLGTPTVGIFIATLPFNYEPRFGQHEIVYNINGGQPEVAQVFSKVEKILS